MLLIFVSLSFPIQAARYQFSVKGIKGALYDNVMLYLEKYSDTEHSPGIRFHNELENDVQTALQALGYYHSDVDISYPSDDATLITLTISANDPVRIASTDIANGKRD